LRGVSNGRPGRTGGRRPSTLEKLRSMAPVEIALDVEHDAQLAQRVRGHGAGNIAAEHHVDAALYGATHDVGRSALGVGRGREAERHAGIGHALKLGIADQVAVNHQQIGAEQARSGELVYGARFVDMDAARRPQLASKGQLLLQIRRADRVDAEADGGEAAGIVELIVDAPAVG